MKCDSCYVSGRRGTARGVVRRLSRQAVGRPGVWTAPCAVLNFSCNHPRRSRLLAVTRVVLSYSAASAHVTVRSPGFITALLVVRIYCFGRPAVATRLIPAIISTGTSTVIVSNFDYRRGVVRWVHSKRNISAVLSVTISIHKILPACIYTRTGTSTRARTVVYTSTGHV